MEVARPSSTQVARRPEARKVLVEKRQEPPAQAKPEGGKKRDRPRSKNKRSSSSAGDESGGIGSLVEISVLTSIEREQDDLDKLICDGTRGRQRKKELLRKHQDLRLQRSTDTNNDNL